MILRVVSPPIDGAIERMRLVRWHRAEGEVVAYGDELCTFQVEEVTRLDRHQRASAIIGRIGAETSDPRGVHPVRYALRLVATDAGYLRQLVKDQDDLVDPGDLIGIVTTEREEPLGLGHDDAPFFRVVVDQVDPTEQV